MASDREMNVAARANAEQIERWNGAGGRAWVDSQELLDRILKPFEDALVAALPRGSAQRLLDVGCGTGATTLAAARRLGAGAECVGVDISEPMLALARMRAEREGLLARFLCADAQTCELESGLYDSIISRFGVMFFDDPARAFANLRRAAAAGASLRCIVWRSAEENLFMTTAERAAAPFLPNLPPREPDAPGQFAFADAGKMRAILEASGWSAIAFEPLDVVCSMPEAALMPYATRLGPVGMVLQDADEATRGRAIEAVRGAFDAFVHGDEVRFDTACWIVSARNPD